MLFLRGKCLLENVNGRWAWITYFFLFLALEEGEAKDFAESGKF